MANMLHDSLTAAEIEDAETMISLTREDANRVAIRFRGVSEMTEALQQLRACLNFVKGVAATLGVDRAHCFPSELEDAWSYLMTMEGEARHAEATRATEIRGRVENLAKTRRGFKAIMAVNDVARILTAAGGVGAKVDAGVIFAAMLDIGVWFEGSDKIRHDLDAAKGRAEAPGRRPKRGKGAQRGKPNS